MFTFVRRMTVTPFPVVFARYFGGLTFGNCNSLRLTALPSFQQRGRFCWESTKAVEEEMSVQDHLLQLTKEVELYFRHLAEHKASTPGIKKILNRLADDEVKAYQYIENLPFCSSIPIILEDGGMLKDQLKHFFSIMTVENMDSDDRDEIHVYEKARDAKGKIRDLYWAKAEKCTDPKAKSILQMAAREADKHYQVLDETVDYLAKAEPGTGRWATCPEFSVVQNSQFQVTLDAY